MNRVITAAGQEIPCNFFGLAIQGVLVMDVQMGFDEAYEAFKDPANNKERRFIYESNGFEEERSVKGYTALSYIENLFRDTEEVRVALQRPFAPLEE